MQYDVRSRLVSVCDTSLIFFIVTSRVCKLINSINAPTNILITFRLSNVYFFKHWGHEIISTFPVQLIFPFFFFYLCRFHLIMMQNQVSKRKKRIKKRIHAKGLQHWGWCFLSFPVGLHLQFSIY